MNTYFENAKPTYLENWPAELCRLSVAQEDIPLTIEEARALGTNIAELGEAFVRLTPEQKEQKKRATASAHARMTAAIAGGPMPDRVPWPEVEWRPGDISGVRERVARAVAFFPGGAFVRLGSRSPKDAWSWREPDAGKIVAGDGDPLRYLLDCSERVADDLQLALDAGYAPHVFVRQWVKIEEWAEFRCFMRGRKLVGVSQYQHNATFPEIAAEQSTLRWAFDFFFQEFFRRPCHLQDVVFDVFVCLKRRGNEAQVDVKLLEINPFGPNTDPCLFDWRSGGKDLDGTFRYRVPGGLASYPIL